MCSYGRATDQRGGVGGDQGGEAGDGGETGELGGAAMNEAAIESPKGVRVFHCETWEGFIAEVRNAKGERIYRGHAKSDWKLSSMFERWPPTTLARKLFPGHELLKSYRERFREYFKDLAIGLPGLESGPQTEDDWWALGRHHGLITPLLDWTMSPYIAAFFALVDFEERLSPGFEALTELILGGSVAVWALDVAQDHLQTEGEFEIVRPTIGYSQHSIWMRAQQSVFTRLTHDVHVDLESYLVSRGLEKRLERYEIRGQEMSKALTDLRLMNISYASLFPDLKGATKQANFLALWDVIGPKKDEA